MAHNLVKVDRHSLGSLLRRLRSETGSQLAAAVVDADRALTPADDRWIALRVAALLGHYRMPDESEAESQLRIADWCAALRRFPRWAIERGVQAWLVSPRGSYRPVPADIHALIRPEVGEMRGLRDRAIAGLRDAAQPVRRRISAEAAAAMIADLAARRAMS